MIIEDYRPTDYGKFQDKIVEFVNTAFAQITRTSEISIDSSDPYWSAIRLFNIAPAPMQEWYRNYLETRGVFQMKVPDRSYQVKDGAFVEINPLYSKETVFGFMFMVMDWA